MRFTLRESVELAGWIQKHVAEAHGGDDRGWGDFEIFELDGDLVNPHVVCCLRCGPPGTVQSAQFDFTDYESA